MYTAAASCKDITWAPMTNWEPYSITLAGYCLAKRHGMKVQLITQYQVSHLQCYGVTVRGNVTSVCPPLWCTCGNVLCPLTTVNASSNLSTQQLFTNLTVPWDLLPLAHPEKTSIMGLNNNPICRCGTKVETSVHIVCECEALASLRHTYLHSFFLDPEDIRVLGMGAIWNFATGTGLL